MGATPAAYAGGAGPAWAILAGRGAAAGLRAGGSDDVKQRACRSGAARAGAFVHEPPPAVGVEVLVRGALAAHEPDVAVGPHEEHARRSAEARLEPRAPRGVRGRRSPDDTNLAGRGHARPRTSPRPRRRRLAGSTTRGSKPAQIEETEQRSLPAKEAASWATPAQHGQVGHAVAGTQSAGTPVVGGERAAAIADRDLADVKWDGLLERPDRPETQGETAEQTANEGTTGRHDVRDPLGLAEDVAHHRQTLLLVGVEQRLRGLPLHHQGELPGEVAHVLDAGVHPLSGGRAVDVRRVAAEEHPADADARDHAAVDAKPGGPAQVAEMRRGGRALVVDRLQVLDRGGGVRARLARRDAARDEAEAPLAQQEQAHEAVLRREEVKIVLREVAVDVQIAQRERLVPGVALEAEVERGPNEAVSAFGIDEPGCLRLLQPAVRRVAARR